MEIIKRREGFSFNLFQEMEGTGKQSGSMSLTTGASPYSNFQFPCILKSAAINARVSKLDGTYEIIDPAKCLLFLVQSFGPSDTYLNFNSWNSTLGNPAFSNNVTDDSTLFELNGGDNYKDLEHLGLIFYGVRGGWYAYNDASIITADDFLNVKITLRFDRI